MEDTDSLNIDLKLQNFINKNNNKKKTHKYNKKLKNNKYNQIKDINIDNILLE